MLELLLAYKYFVMFPMAVVEGPFLALLMGYLVQAGYVNFFTTLIVLLLIDVALDISYYHLGKYGNKKILKSKYFSNSKKTETNLMTLENMWHNHTKKVMFFGKLAYGISLPIIISAGIANLPLKKFILISIPIGALQIFVLLSIGYYLGASYELASRYIQYPGILIAIFLLLVLILYFFFSNYFTKLFNKNTKT